MHRFNPFQWLIDTTQKPSIWWCNILLRFYIIGVLLVPVLSTKPFTSNDAIRMSISLLTAFFLWQDARSQAALASNRWFYLICAWVSWPLVLFSLFLFFLARSAEGSAFLLHSFSFASYCSFALCHPPAPPKHKPSLVSRPTGA